MATNLIEECKITMGQSPSSDTYNEDGIGLPFFQGNADFGIKYPKVRIWCDQPKKIAHRGDILLSVRAPIGAINIADCDCCIGRGLAAISPYDQGNIDYYYFLLQALTKELQLQGTGSTFKAIGKKSLENLQIPEKTPFERKAIANNLLKVEHIIHLYAEGLSCCDELIKARFVEMFGSQLINPKKFNKVQLSDVVDINLGLTHTPTYQENGIPFLSVRDISSGRIDFSHCHYISQNEFDSLPKGSKPLPGDILFCRVGTIGKPVKVDSSIPAFGTFVSVGYLRLKNNNDVTREYLKYWMEDESFYQQVLQHVSGASQINLNTGWLKKFVILVPPMELQKEFSNMVCQIDKSKAAIQKSIDETQLLYDSLMQKYFG